MKNRTLILGTALLVSAALLAKVETFYGAEASTSGKYKMSYEVDGQIKTVTIEVKPNQTELNVKDVVVKLGGKWSPEDNIVFLKDKAGEPLALEKVTIKNNVDLQRAGVYFVKFSYGTYHSIAKVVVQELPDFVHQEKMMIDHSPNDDKVKIMLNDELLKKESSPKKVSISGGAGLSVFTSFGSMLSFLSGTLLYGTRRE